MRYNGELRDILESEVGKKMGRGRPRFEYFFKIMSDVGFPEKEKSWYGIESSGVEWLYQTSLQNEDAR